MQAQPQLRFEGFWVHHLEFIHATAKKNGQFNINMQRNVMYPDPENKNLFHLIFTLEIQDTDTSPSEITLRLAVLGRFEMLGELSEDVIHTFQNISAPTIVYPYIRALVSTLSTQFGLDTIILPVMSFIPVPPQSDEPIALD